MDKIKVTFKDLVEAREPLQRMMQEKLPIKTAYWLAKAARKIDEELREYERLRRELVQRYGEEKQKDYWEVKPENMEQFSKEFNELLACEIELEIAALSPDTLDIMATAADGVALDFLFNDSSQS